MEHLKSQRPCFSGRPLLLIAALIGFSMNVMGYDSGIDEYINEDLVKGVAYDYELFERVPGKLDCKGTLHISLSLPDEVSHIVLNCSLTTILRIDCYGVKSFILETPRI